MKTVFDLVTQMEDYPSDAVAFRFFEGDSLTQISYRAFSLDIKRFASYLIVRFPDIKDKHIALLAGNSYQYLVCLWGIILAGGVAVPLNVRESEDNIAYELAHADTTCVLLDQDSITEEMLAGYRGEIIDIADNRIFNQVLLPICPEVTIDRLAILMYTSGTTGRPRGVMVTQKNIFSTIGNLEHFIADIRKHTGKDSPRMFLCLPLYHMFSLMMCLLWCAHGFPLDLGKSIKSITPDLRRMQSDFAPVVPSILNMWHQDILRGKLSRMGTVRVVITSGAFVDVSKFKDFQEAGILIGQFYGMTETSGAVTAFHTSFHGNTLHAVGKPVSFLEVKIEDGEVCVRGDAVTCGYYKDPAATAAAIKDGWLHTGDLGDLDEEGYLYLTGRKKNLIILSNGENISPEELEEGILRNPLIREAVVKEKNDKICAEIFCEEKDQLEIKTFIEQQNRGRAFYKRITEIEFRDMPFKKGGTGKILRK